MLFKIFESGKYPQGEFLPEQVRAMAEAYDPEGDIEAPCVIGHLDNSLAERLENELTDGWICGLQYRNFADFAELWADCEFSENLKGLIATKRIRYVSAEIAKRDNSLYLVRLAFLGRSIPAISTARVPAMFRWFGTKFGLKFEQEAEENLLSFSRKLELETSAAAGLGNHEEYEKNAEGNDKGEEAMAKFTEAEASQKLTEEQTAKLKFQQKAEAAEAKLAQYRREQEEAAVEVKLAKFRKEGKLIPAEFELARGLALQLQGEYREQYFEQIEGRQAILSLDGQHRATAAEFGGAAGGMRPTQLVRAFARKNGLDFETALEQIRIEQPELYTQAKAQA